MPLSREFHGRLGKPAMEQLGMMADIAGRNGDVQPVIFVRNALRMLDVAMCKGNANILRVGM